MHRIPQSFIDELLSRVDLVEVVDKRVKLKKNGKNYSACCPFHNEKTPSFTVSQDKQFYYCFGCGATGNAVSFLMAFDKLGFMDSLEQLARQAGLSLPEPEQQRSSTQTPSTDPLYALLSEVAAYYQTQLREHPSRQAAERYLAERGLTPEMIARFGVGFAPEGWDLVLNQFGRSLPQRKQLLAAGLIVENDDQSKLYDRFRHRIMFPIQDLRGRVIGFGGRLLGDSNRVGADGKKQKGKGPKYLNSPETALFQKGRNLYGLYQARETRGELQQLLFVEGYMDVIALAQYGLTEAVATLGTACGEDHLRLAFKYTNSLVFCFDGDNAGRKAARRALEQAIPLMEDGRQVKFLLLPEGQDPDSLVRQIGAERFREMLGKAAPLEEFFFSALSDGLDPQSLEGRARLSKLAAPWLERLPKGVYRELMFELLSRRTGLSLDVLRELITLPRQSVAGDEPSPAPKPHDERPSSRTADDSPTTTPIHPPAPAQRQLTARREPRATGAALVSLADRALALLLDNPHLAKDLAPNALPASSALEPLSQLIAYLKQRETASFASILGYWGARFGTEAQRQLAEVLAKQLLHEAKRHSSYDPAKELAVAFAKLCTQAEETARRAEIATLQHKSLDDLSPQERERLRELLRAKPSV
jgi:DNA primase